MCRTEARNHAGICERAARSKLRTWSSRYVQSDTKHLKTLVGTQLPQRIYPLMSTANKVGFLAGGILLVHNYPAHSSCMTGDVKAASRLNPRNGPDTKGKGSREGISILRCSSLWSFGVILNQVDAQRDGKPSEKRIGVKQGY
jgi:hypothetical protein